MKQENGTAAVEAAKAGDEEAREQLVAAHLPLIYNVVGRALDGHADVDDVVQETMLRVLESLADLREPASFRSWLVAIAMNQVRRRWTTARKAPLVGLDQVQERADHSADFVDLTILKLGLSGQRREVAAPPAGWTSGTGRCCPCGGWRRPARSPGRSWSPPSGSTPAMRRSGCSA